MSNPNQPTPSAPAPAINWVVQAGGIEPVPVASYFATFLRVESTTIPSEPDVPKLRWTWEVATGAMKGKLITALTPATIKPTNHCGRILMGMAGRAL